MKITIRKLIEFINDDSWKLPNEDWYIEYVDIQNPLLNDENQPNSGLTLSDTINPDDYYHVTDGIFSKRLSSYFKKWMDQQTYIEYIIQIPKTECESVLHQLQKMNCKVSRS